ncbi:farnesyl pyrophosphate synthase [Brevipalpus obovatus]|uniref:farnesyl pyrophosphate synthase n=1 Tax=Brevipalpus obovatus TaxID=246614 RepID=UPI003D9E963E
MIEARFSHEQEMRYRIGWAFLVANKVRHVSSINTVSLFTLSSSSIIMSQVSSRSVRSNGTANGAGNTPVSTATSTTTTAATNGATNDKHHHIGIPASNGNSNSNNSSNGVKNGSNGANGVVDIERTEAKLFDEAFEVVTNKLVNNNDPELGTVSDWLRKVLEYNVPHGKKNRGMALVLAYKLLMRNKSVNQNSNGIHSEQNGKPVVKDSINTTATMNGSNDKSELARILGWCIEILQAFFLVHDDIMDQSLTRRGQPCWYKKNDVGLIAISDGILLNCCLYTLLREYLSQEPTYLRMLQLFNEITDFTAKGQCLDMLQSSSSTCSGYSNFDDKTYHTIVKYKTAYYSFSLPIRLALYLAGITDEKIHTKAEEILLKCGTFFQVQDDFLDCFGDPEIIGKVGRDIEEGKCCWPFVTALKLCSDEQRSILLENYGKDDVNAVKAVKKVYKQIDLEKVYSELEEKNYQEIRSLIDEFEYTNQVPTEVFEWILEKIHHRNK